MAIDGISGSQRSPHWNPRHDGWREPSMVGHWSGDHRYSMRRTLFRSPPARRGGDSYQQMTPLICGYEPAVQTYLSPTFKLLLRPLRLGEYSRANINR